MRIANNKYFYILFSFLNVLSWDEPTGSVDPEPFNSPASFSH